MEETVPSEEVKELGVGSSGGGGVKISAQEAIEPAVQEELERQGSFVAAVARSFAGKFSSEPIMQLLCP
jgi:hypothetical protein